LNYTRERSALSLTAGATGRAEATCLDMLPDGADSLGSLSPCQAARLLPAKGRATGPDGSDGDRRRRQRR